MEKDDANIPLEDISISVTVDDRISSQSLEMLKKAFEERNLEDFREALSKGVDLTQPYKKNLSIFGAICKSPESAEFIRVSIEHQTNGILKEYITDTNEYPIHYAIKSYDYKNILTIVENVGDNSPYNVGDKNFSILHIFFELMNNNNFNKIFECLKKVLLTIKEGHDVNEYNCTNNNQDAIYFLLQSKHLKNSNKKNVLNFFTRYLYDFKINDVAEEEIKKLFPKFKLPTEILKACYKGDEQNLKSLFSKTDDSIIDESPLLSAVIEGIINTKDEKDKDKFNNCLQFLLKMKKININAKDNDKNSALYYAVQSRNQKLILDILKKGAYLGGRNKDDYYIKNIDPTILKDLLDSCISTHNHTSHDHFIIQFKYASFKPDNSCECPDEMDIFMYFSRTPEFKDLLMHPICTSLIALKWLPLKYPFYFNAFINIFYYILSIIFFTFSENNKDPLKPVESIFPLSLYIISVFCYIVIIFNAYFNQSKVNMILILLLYPRYRSYEFEYPIYTFCIFFAAIQIMYAFKGVRFFSIAKFIYLFVKVLKNFLEIMVFYGIIVIIFAFVFYKNYYEYNKVTFGVTTNNSTQNVSDEKDNQEIESQKFQHFYSVDISILKTFIMSTGEMDAGKYNFAENNLIYYLLITFIISITIVLSNLLTGLAVNDVETILNEANLHDIVQRVEILSRFEIAANFLLRKMPWLQKFRLYKKFFIFKDCIKNYQIQIFPHKPEMYVTSVPPGIKETEAAPILKNTKSKWNIRENEFESIIRKTLEVREELELKKKEMDKKEAFRKKLSKARYDIVNHVKKRFDEVLANSKKDLKNNI